MRPFNLTLPLILSTAAVCFAQKTVTGRVVDKAYGSGVAEASIVVAGTDFEVLSDVNGYFKLPFDSAMNLDITTRYHLPATLRLTDTSRFVLHLALDPAKADDKNTIYVVVEHPATYPGGISNFYEYLKKNMKRPKSTSTASGNVYVEFVVEKDGRLNEVVVRKTLNAACDEEALRLVKSSQNWIPAKQRNQIVRQRMMVPVKF